MLCSCATRAKEVVLIALMACVLGLKGVANAQPFGLGPRSPNVTLRMPVQPATYGYTLTNAFNLTFSNPVNLATAPGDSNRLFVVERGGRVIVITNLAVPTRTVFMDISGYIPSNYLTTEEEGLASIAFHPGYATNRYVYAVFVIFTNTAAGSGRHQRLARFQTSATNSNFTPASSERPFITQRDEYVYHSYNDLKFGPDGYLYVAVCDEGGFNDPGDNSQRIDKDLFSGVLRIDVDKRPGSLAPNPHPAVTTNYAIPPDNPFVGATSFNGLSVNPSAVRTEFYAVGLRNPYRLVFEPTTGLLLCGDVGEARVEELNVIVKGGNYGWAFLEGTLAGLKPNLPPVPPGFSPTFPMVQYFHGTTTNEGNCIVAGVVPSGSTPLNGAFIYGDYTSGNIWALRHNGTNVLSREWLTASPGLSGFGMDPRNGDVLVVYPSAGVIKRLGNSTNATGSLLPPTLSETGAFANLATLTPQPGVVPYDVNVPFWSDNALKTRWFSIPNTNLVMGFNATSQWSFPTGAVWIKHFELTLTNGVAPKRIETRFVVRNASGVYGATYRWGNSMTNATLVPESGMDEIFPVREGTLVRTQLWHYPGRGECLMCHTPGGGYVLGFNTAQLNRDFNYAGTTDNQVRAMSHAGYLNTNVLTVNFLRRLATATNEAWSREYRVRSYFAANCAQCHHPGGSGRGFWDARITTPFPMAGVIRGALQDNQGDTNNRVVVPGSLSRSVLFSRVSRFDGFHMPPLATSVIDSQATNLLAKWIQSEATTFRTFVDWQMEHFGGTNAAQAASNADPDLDGAPNLLEYYTGTDPLQSASRWTIGIRDLNGVMQVILPQVANRGFEIQVATNLFGIIAWKPFDDRVNQPFFCASNQITILPVPGGNVPRQFYRVRVFDP